MICKYAGGTSEVCKEQGVEIGNKRGLFSVPHLTSGAETVLVPRAQ